MCLPECVSNNPSFSQNSLMVIAEVHLASIVRTTGACAATVLAQLREMSTGLPKIGESFRHHYHYRLRPTQNKPLQVTLKNNDLKEGKREEGREEGRRRGRGKGKGEGKGERKRKQAQ